MSQKKVISIRLWPNQLSELERIRRKRVNEKLWYRRKFTRQEVIEEAIDEYIERNPEKKD